MDNVPSVIGVRRRSAKQVSEQVSCDDRIGGRTTDSLVCPLTERIDPAGAHGAVAAAYAQFTESALGPLRFEPIPSDGQLSSACKIYHRLRSCIDRTPVVVTHTNFFSEHRSRPFLDSCVIDSCAANTR
jgi:hypothetical protein